MANQPSNETSMASLLQELVTWTKFTARQSLEQTLRSVLKDPRHQAAYELSDGTRTQSEIGSAVGLDQSTISQLCARWRRLGLLREGEKRPRNLMSLSDLGWDVSLVPKPQRRRRQGQDAETEARAEEA